MTRNLAKFLAALALLAPLPAVAQSYPSPRLTTSVALDGFKQAADTSDCPAMQRAYAALSTSGGEILLPPRVIRPGTCSVLINNAGVRWVGSMAAENQGGSASSAYGTWIEITDTTESLFSLSGSKAAGSEFEHIAFAEDGIQATPTSGWVPVVVPPVID